MLINSKKNCSKRSNKTNRTGLLFFLFVNDSKIYTILLYIRGGRKKINSRNYPKFGPPYNLQWFYRIMDALVNTFAERIAHISPVSPQIIQ